MPHPRLEGLTAWSHDEARRLARGGLLRTSLVWRARAGLGGSHTVVTYPPLDALAPLDPAELLARVHPVSELNVYLHVAFCEHLCPFCHYAKTISPVDAYDARVAAYLKALADENSRWSALLRSSRLLSLYVGGGTPTAVPTPRLCALIERVTSAFEHAAGFQVAVETSPLTAAAPDGPSKLRELVGVGTGRLSMGLQTFDDRLLRGSRGHDQALALRAVETVMNAGVEVNLDLMQDLPGQDDASLLEDLTWIDRFRPHQVTWYILRFQRGSPWHALYTQGRLALPSDDDSVRRRLLLRRGMALLGYAARPGGRFARVQGAIDRFKKVRAGLDATLLGLGASAYSHGWGYFFRNAGTQPGAAGVDEYTARVDSGRWPIATGLALDTVEREAARLVSGLRSGVELPSSALEEGGLRAEAARRLRTLADQGLVQADGARFSLTEAGCLFEEEICSLFYSPAVKARLATSGAYWATETAQEDPAHVRRS